MGKSWRYFWDFSWFGRLWVWLKTPITPKGMTPHSSLFNILRWSLQRAWRGYSDWDASEADNYLGFVIAGVIKQHVREYGPAWCPPEYNEENSFYNGRDWRADLEEWCALLDKSAEWLGDTIPDEIDSSLWFEEGKKAWEQSADRMKKWLPGMNT